MKVVDIIGVQHVSSAEELDSVLNAKRLTSNSFWLSDDEYPILAVLTKDDLASLSYMPADREAGYRSIGLNALDPNGITWFSISEHSADDIAVPNDGVVDIPTAVRAAIQFFETKNLPSCINWLKL